MGQLSKEQLDVIRARLDALELLQGTLSRVKQLRDPDWRLGVIADHVAHPLEGRHADIAWSFVEHSPYDIRKLLSHIDALEAENERLRHELVVWEMGSRGWP